MRAIRVTVDRRHEGIRVAIAMSPSLLDEVVERSGEVHFSTLTDSDLALDLDLEVDGPLDPEEADEQLARVEFEPEAEEYETIPDED
jgi:hypothetical protein